MTTQFVLMYHPALGNRQATVPLQAVDDYAATGWLLVDPEVTPPAPPVPYTTVAQVASQASDGNTPIGGALRAAFDTKYAPAKIDLCQAPYSCAPGDDVTAELQAAINALVDTGMGGEVYFSRPGVYNIDGAPQTGTVLGYTYNGQILFPGTPYTTQPTIPVTIRGASRASGGLTPWVGGNGDSTSTGAPNGVVLQSNGPAGAYIFDTVPAQAGWGMAWTGVMPIFRDIIVRSPDNPANGGINLFCALRCELDKVIVDTVHSWVKPTNVASLAVRMPAHFNNGDIVMTGEIHGFYRAVEISEHCAFPKLDISNCRTAFYAITGGHSNWFGYVDTEGIGALFEIGTNTGLQVFGHIDMENSLPTSRFPNTLLLDSPAGGRLVGAVDLWMNAGLSGNNFTAAMGANATAASALSLSINGSARTAESHPSDNFYRFNNVAQTSGDGAPGQCNPSGHLWRGATSVSVPSDGTMKFTAAGQIQVPARNEPRAISTTVAVAAVPVVALVAHQGPAGGPIWFSLANPTTVRLGIATAPNYGGKVREVTIPSVANSTLTLTLELLYRDGRPYLVKGRVNGATVIAYPLSAAQIAALAGATNSIALPGFEDGIYCNDTTSVFTAFRVKPVSESGAAISGVVPLVAGAATVADPSITASAAVRVSRQAAGGSLGYLSVALTPGTGFTINSSSATDTSSVLYEIINY